jgi:carbonic anhydrase
MKLFEAILDANRRAAGQSEQAELAWKEHEASLPVVVLTCIDPRLTRWVPGMFGLPEEKFVWLRNAGNIITGPVSSTVRSIAMACFVKGAREIAVMGHTDCLVGKTTMLQLTDAMKNFGVQRAALPENLVEYFGLFASERQNVLKAVDLLRSSPLIGPAIPVHGLLMDTNNGRLEWLVNGYQSLETVASKFTSAIKKPDVMPDMTESLPEFKSAELGMPTTEICSSATKVNPLVNSTTPTREPVGAERLEEKIGQTRTQDISGTSQTEPAARTESQTTSEAAASDTAALARRIDPSKRYRLIGTDNKIYGPVPGKTVQLWLMDNRIDEQTPIQEEGAEGWQKLGALKPQGHPPQPPPVPASTKFKKRY